MNNREVGMLKEYVIKRFKEVNMDYKTFQEECDETLTYVEQKRIYEEKLNELLPMVVPKRKKDADESARVRAEYDKQMKEQQEKEQAEIKKRLEDEIAKITKDSKELEVLYQMANDKISMVAKSKEVTGLLLYGESSLGKSYHVKKVLKEKGIKDYVFVSGHITPMKFYDKLYKAKDSLVIFDDVDILGNIIILNMIKAALNENSANVVEYHTTKKMDIPSSFVFSGRVIILLNDIPKKNEHLKAVESRLLKHHLKFSREETITIISSIAHKKEIEGTTIEDRIMIANWIKDNTSIATENLNIRLYLQAIEFYKYDKTKWKELTKSQIKTDGYMELVVQNVSDDDWVERTGLSIKSKQRLRAKMGLTRKYGSIGQLDTKNICEVEN